MTYSEKLKDPRWQKKRLEVLERDKFECVLCGDKENTLHVHHSKYRSNPWDVSEDCLFTLCKPCHDGIEEIKTKVANPHLGELLRDAIRALETIEDRDDNRYQAVMVLKWIGKSDPFRKIVFNLLTLTHESWEEGLERGQNLFKRTPEAA